MKNLIAAFLLAWAIAASWIANSYKQSAELYQKELARSVEPPKILDNRSETNGAALPSASLILGETKPETKNPQKSSESLVTATSTQASGDEPKKKFDRSSEAAKRLNSFMADTRVKVVGKFVTLNETQREQLRNLYLEQKEKRASFNSAEMKEKLVEIIGKESAEFFDSQREAAFERRESEQQLKQALYLSRQLGLNTDQEAKLIQSMKFVQSELENFEATDPAGDGVTFETAPEDKMRFYVERSQFEAELLRSEVEKFLEPEKYKKYLEMEAQSEAADMTLWH